MAINNDNHWKNIERFLSRRSAERGYKDPSQMLKLFKEYWDELADEAGMQTAADAGRLDEIDKRIANEDGARPALLTEKAALETILGQ